MEMKNHRMVNHVRIPPDLVFFHFHGFILALETTYMTELEQMTFIAMLAFAATITELVWHVITMEKKPN